MRKIFSLLTAGDLILAVVFLIAAGLIFAGTAAAPREAGSSIIITRNGVIEGEYPLDKDARIRLEWQGHSNLLVIEDGRAHMEEANCPDGYCLRQGPIHRQRETIVCLPARLVVTVSGGKEDDIDAFSY